MTSLEVTHAEMLVRQTAYSSRSKQPDKRQQTPLPENSLVIDTDVCYDTDLSATCEIGSNSLQIQFDFDLNCPVTYVRDTKISSDTAQKGKIFHDTVLMKVDGV